MNAKKIRQTALSVLAGIVLLWVFFRFLLGVFLP